MANYSAYLHDDSDPESLHAIDFPLILNSCGYQHFHHTDFMVDRPLGRADYHLIYIAKGNATFYKEGKPLSLTKGHLIFYHPHERQQYSYSDSIDTHVYWIHFTGSLTEHYLKQFNLFHQSIFYIEYSPELISLFNNLIFEAQRHFIHHEIIIEGLLLQFLALIARQAHFAKIGLTTHFSKDIQLAIQFIQEHYSEALSVDSLAKIANLSRYHFIRKFKQAMGTTPTDYLITLRINKACELLVGTNQSIQSISHQVGYEDALYFSKVFKKVKGIAPLHYRQINLGNH